MSLADFEERRDVLIELIEWYRDEYHSHDPIHSEMIESIKELKHNDFKRLEMYERSVDDWLDY